MRFGDYLWALFLLQNQGHENPKSLGCLRHPTGHSPTPLRVWRSEGLRGTADTENTWPSVSAKESGVHSRGFPPSQSRGPDPTVIRGAGRHPHRCRINLRKEQNFSQIQGRSQAALATRRVRPGQAARGRAAVGLTGAPGARRAGASGRSARGGMHESGERHTLTALSPRMSSFFISSVTRMSWRQRDEGHAAGKRQAGRGGPGQSGHSRGRGLPSRLPPRSMPGGGSCHPRRECGGS